MGRKWKIDLTKTEKIKEELNLLNAEMCRELRGITSRSTGSRIS